MSLISDIGDVIASAGKAVAGVFDAAVHALVTRPIETVSDVTWLIAGGPAAIFVIEKSVAGKLGVTVTSPSDLGQRMFDAARSGDLKKVRDVALETGHQLSDALSYVPGPGTALAAGLNEAIDIAESGTPIRKALEPLISAAAGPPMPPGVADDVLRPLADVLSDLVEKGASISDVVIAEIRKRFLDKVRARYPTPVPGLVGDFFDAAIDVVARGKPIISVGAAVTKGAAGEVLKAAAPQDVRDGLNAAKDFADTMQGLYVGAQTIAGATRMQAGRLGPQRSVGLIDQRDVAKRVHAMMLAERAAAASRARARMPQLTKNVRLITSVPSRPLWRPLHTPISTRRPSAKRSHTKLTAVSAIVGAAFGGLLGGTLLSVLLGAATSAYVGHWLASKRR